MREKFAVLFLFCAVAALPQEPVPGPGSLLPLFPAELQKYLELTNPQVESMNRLNVELTAFVLRREARRRQVQEEIDEWTRKDPIDPQALGIRYAELEVIRREIRDETAKTQQKIRALLTDAQRIKLKVLEDAGKLAPLVNDAVCENLLGPMPTARVDSVIPGVQRVANVAVPQFGVLCRTLVNIPVIRDPLPVHAP